MLDQTLTLMFCNSRQCVTKLLDSCFTIYVPVLTFHVLTLHSIQVKLLHLLVLSVSDLTIAFFIEFNERPKGKYIYLRKGLWTNFQGFLLLALHWMLNAYSLTTLLVDYCCWFISVFFTSKTLLKVIHHVDVVYKWSLSSPVTICCNSDGRASDSWCESMELFFFANNCCDLRVAGQLRFFKFIRGIKQYSKCSDFFVSFVSTSFFCSTLTIYKLVLFLLFHLN